MLREWTSIFAVTRRECKVWTVLCKESYVKRFCNIVQQKGKMPEICLDLHYGLMFLPSFESVFFCLINIVKK